MVGHIAQTGQIVATDFKAGNVLPNTEALSAQLLPRAGKC
jgi:hypothetical protein